MGLGGARLGPLKEQENRRIRRDERSAAEKHCQPLACQLQRCATRYTYKQEKCDGLKAQYNACIENFLAAATAAVAGAASTPQ
jgi:hypothetical protein